MKILKVIILLGLGLTLPSLAMANDLAGAKTFVQDNIINSYEELSDPSLSQQKRIRAAVNLLEAHVSFPAVARLSVGHYWRQMDEAQQTRYETLFESWMIAVLSQRLAGIDFAEKSTVTLGNALQNKRTFVITTNAETGGETVSFDWHLRHLKAGFKVIDVVVENISMVQAQRAEFSAVINEQGIDGFLTTLQMMVANISKVPNASQNAS